MFDAENRISSIMTGTTTLSFVYDGNGKRVVQNVTDASGKAAITTSTLYVGNLYEEEVSSTQNPKPYTVYYFLGGKMVGMRKANYVAGNGANG